MKQLEVSSKNQLSLNQQRVLRLFETSTSLKISDVVSKIQLRRPTAKQVLSRLVDLGIIEQAGQLRGTYYSLRATDQVVDTFGNELVAVYKGESGFRRLFGRILHHLKRGDFYWSFAFKDEYSDSSLKEFLTNFHINFHEKMTQNGVQDRTIVHPSVVRVIQETYRHVPGLKIRVSEQEVPIGTSIMRDQVIHWVWGEQPTAIAISSQAIVDRYISFFKSCWRKATTTDKN